MQLTWIGTTTTMTGTTIVKTVIKGKVVRERLWKKDFWKKIVKEVLWEKDWEQKTMKGRLNEWNNKRDWLQRWGESFWTLFPHFWHDKNKVGRRPIVAKRQINVCVRVCVCVWVICTFGLQIVFLNHLC